MTKATSLGVLYRTQYALMVEVRTYYDNSETKSKFVLSIISYFENKGSLTAKQQAAIEGWLQKEKNRLQYTGKTLPVVVQPQTRTRFSNVLQRRGADT